MTYSGAGILHTLTHINSHNPLSNTLVTIPILHIRKPTLSKISEEHIVNVRAGILMYLCLIPKNWVLMMTVLHWPSHLFCPCLFDWFHSILFPSVCLSHTGTCIRTCQPHNKQPQTDAWMFRPDAWCQGRVSIWIKNSSLPDAVCLFCPLWILWLQTVILSDGSLQTLWTLLTFAPQGSETCWSCHPELIGSQGDSLLLEHLQALNHSWSFCFIRDISYLGWCHSTLNHLSLGVKLHFLTFDG